ncbi:MAG: hypothetical protein JKY76_01585, partial [Proteobacteria bacterium]|nr:hypothetical protein [Pseudomonadota bacterium]
KAKSILADRMFKGEVALLNYGVRSAPSGNVDQDLDDASPLPVSRPVPLAPEIEAWVEVKLTYDDGEPVANQEYLIIDANDAEYSGTTGSDGSARVPSMASGICKISFNGCNEWY